MWSTKTKLCGNVPCKHFLCFIDTSDLWVGHRLLPLVLVMPCIGPIVKVASMLAAIAELDLDVIGMLSVYHQHVIFNIHIRSEYI